MFANSLSLLFPLYGTAGIGIALVILQSTPGPRPTAPVPTPPAPLAGFTARRYPPLAPLPEAKPQRPPLALPYFLAAGQSEVPHGN